MRPAALLAAVLGALTTTAAHARALPQPVALAMHFIVHPTRWRDTTEPLAPPRLVAPASSSALKLEWDSTIACSTFTLLADDFWSQRGASPVPPTPPTRVVYSGPADGTELTDRLVPGAPVTLQLVALDAVRSFRDCAALRVLCSQQGSRRR
jgi:hypothetical protein